MVEVEDVVEVEVEVGVEAEFDFGVEVVAGGVVKGEIMNACILRVGFDNKDIVNGLMKI